MIANTPYCAYVNNSEEIETQIHTHYPLKKKVVNAVFYYNPFDLFNWLNIVSCESLFLGIFQSSANILLRTIISTSLVPCILSRAISNAFQQPLTHQISMRIRQLEELNDLAARLHDDRQLLGRATT